MNREFWVKRRYSEKRTYISRREALKGAEHIRVHVEGEGGVYAQLYPYHCPDADHWHLSHYRQGTAVCTRRVPAWFADNFWVISAHDGDFNAACAGEGTNAAYYPEMPPVNSGSTQGSDTRQRISTSPKGGK